MLLLQTGKTLTTEVCIKTNFGTYFSQRMFSGQSPFSRRKLADNGPAEDEFDF